MKKIFCVFFLCAISAPALSKNLRIPIDPAPAGHSQYNRSERGGVCTGSDFTVVVSSRGWVLKVDHQGKVIWREKSVCSPSIGPVADQQKIFYACDNGQMIAVDLEQGKLAWKFEFQDSVASKPALSAENIFFVTGDGRAFALNKNDGSIRWVQRLAGRYGLSLRAAGQPLLTPNALYLGLGDGTVAAIDPENGDLIWKKRIFEQSIQSAVSFPMLFDANGVYPSSRQGVCALSTTSSMLFWCLNEELAIEPVQYQNSIYALNTTNGLLKIDKIAGIVDQRIQLKKSRWREKFEYQKPLLIFTIGPELRVLFTDKIMKIDPKTGKGRKMKTFRKPIERGLFSGGKLYLLSSSGYLEIITLSE